MVGMRATRCRSETPICRGFVFFAKTPPERRLCSFLRDLRAPPRPRSPPLHIAAFRFARARSHAIQAALLAPLRLYTIYPPNTKHIKLCLAARRLIFISHIGAHHYTTHPIVFYLYIMIILYAVYKAALHHPVKSLSPSKFRRDRLPGGFL